MLAQEQEIKELNKLNKKDKMKDVAYRNTYF